MQSTARKTLNEIDRMCQKALEGAGAPAGLDIEVAQNVLWLLSCDLPALEDLIIALESLESMGNTSCRFDDHALADLKQANKILDAKDKAGALIASAIVDLLVAKADAQKGIGSIKINNMSSPLFLLPRAAYYSYNKLSFDFHLGAAEDIHYICRLTPEQDIKIWGLPVSKDLSELMGEKKLTLQAFCYSRTDDLPDLSDIGLTILIDNVSCMVAQEHHRTSGIQIPLLLWDQLQMFAMRVFVPTTEISRLRGAGDQSRDNA